VNLPSRSRGWRAQTSCGWLGQLPLDLIGQFLPWRLLRLGRPEATPVADHRTAQPATAKPAPAQPEQTAAARPATAPSRQRDFASEDEGRRSEEAAAARRDYKEAEARLREAYSKEKYQIELMSRAAQANALQVRDRSRSDAMRRSHNELVHANQRCQMAQNALNRQLPGLGAATQSSCEQEHAAIQARYQQSVAEAQVTYEESARVENTERSRELAEAATRFDRSRADLKLRMASR
jgi:hypothetical protein